MSVIVTGMDLPSKCAYCDAQFNYECRYTRRHCKDFFDKRSDDCHMKSVEGLIDAIHKKANSGQWNEAVVFGVGLAIKVIKDYCEVSECE